MHYLEVNLSYTISDLAQIESHNKRGKKVYESDPNIKRNISKNNIDKVPLTDKYHQSLIEKEYNHKM